MQANPPHILITNYAMLEYLLLRPADSVLFDGPTGTHWRFIVVDEAHTYDGASGIEVGMLLRRLKDRVVRSEPGRLTCIATSATLGRGRDDGAEVTSFATNLFGEAFLWDKSDDTQQDMIVGERERMSAMADAIWGTGTAQLYAALVAAVERDVTATELIAVAQGHNVPSNVVEAAEACSRRPPARAVIGCILWAILHGDANVQELQKALEGPCYLDDLTKGRSGALADIQGLKNLVYLAVKAREEPGNAPLLPARYHIFVRALEGAFVCFNTASPAHRVDGKPRLFLNPFINCPHCHAKVKEIAVCTRCGACYLIESRAEAPDANREDNLGHLPYNEGLSLENVSRYLLDGHTLPTDEDEAAALGDSMDELEEGELPKQTICLQCGKPLSDGEYCFCPSDAPKITVLSVPQDGSKRGGARCVVCGSRSRNGPVYRFVTGKDAPVSVLATSLYGMLPTSREERMIELPGQGRKLLAFSDSRQDSAFLAPYIERTYKRILYRRLILQALDSDDDARSGDLRLSDLEPRLIAMADAAYLFVDDKSRDYKRRWAREIMMRELIAMDYRIGLEGLGLLHLRPLRPKAYQAPEPLLLEPWNLAPDETWVLIQVLFNTLRRAGAMTFPENVSPMDEGFKPRNVEISFCESSNTKQHILGWCPTRGINGRQRYLMQLLMVRRGMSELDAKGAASEALNGLWRWVTNSNGCMRNHLEVIADRRGVRYRLKHDLWEWALAASTNTPVYICDHCRNVVYQNLSSVCPTPGCNGRLQQLEQKDLKENHYRQLYQSFIPIALLAQEHTAQWNTETAATVQESFIQGKVNLLSCSTTFELGVDVGDLQTVFMADIPPTIANYVQRAGRAGRRTDTAALILTYAQRRSHDLTQFRDPIQLVAGRVPPPQIVIENERIVRRHMHAVLLADFLRKAKQEDGREFNNTGSFFEDDGSQPTGTMLLRQFAETHPVRTREALERIVPPDPDLQRVFGLASWDWLQGLINSERTGILDSAESEVCGDLRYYAEEYQKHIATQELHTAIHLKEIAKTVRGRNLLGFLASRNVLPKYGFPTDVVPLHTEHIDRREANQVELERDLRIAIGEYAPGAEVVAAKLVWRSRGLFLMKGRSWQPHHYSICPECERYHGSTTTQEDLCRICGTSLVGRKVKHGTFIVPEWGFIAENSPQNAGDARPVRLHSSRVYFAEYAPDPHAAPTEEEIQPSKVQGISQRYSRYGKMAVVNAGPSGYGFRVCSSCGWSEPISINHGQSKKHDDPRSTRECSGKIETYHLGHEFVTDVLELRFDGLSDAICSQPTGRSTLYALLGGASQALGIPRDDLDGTLYPYQSGQPSALVLYDNVPGGAGHVKRIRDRLDEVVKKAYNLVNECTCGLETSCYGCLRNYYNQYYHDILRRGEARLMLGRFID